jgi:hypothetical protein
MQPGGVWIAAFLALVGLFQFGAWVVRCLTSSCIAPVFRFELRDFGCSGFLAVNPLARIPVSVGCYSAPRGRPLGQKYRGAPGGDRSVGNR